MKIALASPRPPKSLAEGLKSLEALVKDAANQQAVIVCFPESFLPGYPGMGYPETDRSDINLRAALDEVCRIAAENAIAIIVPMDWHGPKGLLNLAYVLHF